jgi:hypothetical protein
VSDTGIRLRYDSRTWSASDVTGQRVILKTSTESGYVIAAVIAVPSIESTVQLLNQQLAAERQGYLGLERDTAAAHQLLGPEVGFVHAAGAMYHATSDQPPSPAERVELTFEVATLGRSTVLIEAVTNEDPVQKGRSPFPGYSEIDRLMDSFQWTASA